MLVKERKHNTRKYSKYWVGDNSVLEKICKNDQKLGRWSDDTGKNLQTFSKIGWVDGFGVLADFFSIRSENVFPLQLPPDGGFPAWPSYIVHFIVAIAFGNRVNNFRILDITTFRVWTIHFQLFAHYQI